MRSLEPLQAPVDPVEALRRVGFLLERSRQHSRRVEAFRGAVAVLRDLDEGEVRQRVEDGTITELAGIGPSPPGGIEQALRGELPGELAPDAGGGAGDQCRAHAPRVRSKSSRSSRQCRSSPACWWLEVSVIV